MGIALLESWDRTINKAFRTTIITVGPKSIPERHEAWVNVPALRDSISALKGRYIDYFGKRETFIYGYYVRYSVTKAGAYIVDELISLEELPEEIVFGSSANTGIIPSELKVIVPINQTRRAKLSPQISVGNGVVTVNTAACELIADGKESYSYAIFLNASNDIYIRFVTEHQEGATKISRRIGKNGEVMPGIQIRNAGLIEKVFMPFQKDTSGPVKRYNVELCSEDKATLKVLCNR